MSNASTLVRTMLVYSLCLPLAIILGYLAAQPFDLTTLTIIGLVLFVLVTPMLLRWHHTWLIATWNSSLMLILIHSPVSMALSWISLVISGLQYALNRKLKFLPVGPIAKPLLFLVAVVLITAYFRGGIGLQMLGGSSVGGKSYVILLSAVAGFFALTARRVPLERAMFFVGIFFAGQATLALSDLSNFAGPGLNFLFYLFPPATNLAAQPTDVGDWGITRLGCLATAAGAIMWYMLARHGIQRIFAWRHLGRLVIFFALLVITLLGGFRSILLFFLLNFGILFCLEGLVRKPLMPAFVLVAILGGSLLIPFVNHLPFSVQRTLSFLPLRVDPIAKLSADASTEWRIQMWKNVLPLVPEYFWLGKGYAINANDLAMVGKTPLESGTSGSEIAGDYHNGPLSVIIPFGIFGVIAFLWFLIASVKALHQNYLHGDPSLVYVNRFLLSLFIAKFIFFFAVFGGFSNDLAYFVGMIGLSICLNGGIAARAVVPQARIVYHRLRLPQPLRKPVGA